MAYPDKNGGALTPPNRAPAAKVLAGALANNRVAQALIASLGAYSIPALIVATNVSTTIDFGALAVGDKVLHISVAGGTNDLTTVATKGTLAEAAIVGDVYVVFRAVNLDAANPIVPAGGDLTGRQTGDGGQDF
jgi:hypothetical protein